MTNEVVFVYILACLMAAASFLLNRWLWKCFGNVVVISYGPLVEELAKTLPAFFLGANIFLTHSVFGIIEAVYDLLNSARQTKAIAVLLSVVGHSTFGGITYFILAQFNNIWMAVVSGVICHVVWNMAVVRYSTSQRGE